MKLNIPTILIAFTLTAVAGCSSGLETATIVPADGSTGSSKSTPASPSDGAGSSDEIVAPKDATPAPAPATGDSASDDSKTPLPTPPKAPEDPTAPKEGDKSAEAAPAPVIITWIDPAIFAPKKTLKLVATKNIHTVTCEETNPDSSCGGTGGEAHEYKCPRNYVVTGYELGAADFGCPGDDGGCADYTIVGSLRITCALPTPEYIDPETSDYAYDYTDTSRLTAGAGSFDDRRADGCLNFTGVATGLFGRGGDRLDSVGFNCGFYMHTETNAAIDPKSAAKSATYTWPDVPFGGAPGTGGAPFSISCPAGQAVVGVTVRSGSDVDGIASIDCAELDPILN